MVPPVTISTTVPPIPPLTDTERLSPVQSPTHSSHSPNDRSRRSASQPSPFGYSCSPVIPSPEAGDLTHHPHVANRQAQPDPATVILPHWTSQVNKNDHETDESSKVGAQAGPRSSSSRQVSSSPERREARSIRIRPGENHPGWPGFQVPDSPLPPSEELSADLFHVDVDLGPLRSVSRNHAIIEYRPHVGQFCLQVLGRNGVWVDGVYFVRGSSVLLSKGYVQVHIGS